MLAVHLLAVAAVSSEAQEIGVAGTVVGTVKDPTGGVMVGASVRLSNPVTGFLRTTTTDKDGAFVFRNLPPNPYQLQVTARGFQTLDQNLDVRGSVPLTVTLTLQLATAATSVQVTGTADMVENDPTAHTDIDQSLITKLPIESSSGLNSVIMQSVPGIAADANGFFHPLGDHAQTQFSIDNQPVPDQQSRIYSNQISPDAVQSMEVITGVAPAEFGDKTSLVVSIVTKSGLDQPTPTGSVDLGYGSFSSPTGDLTIGGGSHTVADLLSASGMRTDRYLDPPEFDAVHDNGSDATFFDRFDAHPNAANAFHVNVNAGRSSFDVPNTYDQAAVGQDQHQQIDTFNVAPSYTRVVGSDLLVAANAYVREDHLVYTPSPDPFADAPATISQNRRLTNIGGKVDISYARGVHNVKFGGVISATRLNENTSFGLTDPTLNAPCTDADGNPSDDTSLVDVSQCDAAGLVANDAFVPGLLPFDLSRGGSLFHFMDAATIKQQAAYIQDEIHAGQATFNLGVRVDHYNGLSQATMPEPRLGAAYAVRRTNTVLRASYGRTLETPYNENLLLSSSTGQNGFANPAYGAEEVEPLQPGRRNEMEVGIQQALGRWIVVDFSYFNKHTKNAYDFDVLFDTPVVFPISWDHSRLNGVNGRVDLVQHGGFSAYTVFGHTNAIYSNPENGGILFDTPLPSGDFRIDHDQKFQQTTNLQYIFNKTAGAWVSFNWQYESGLVSGGPFYYSDYLGLPADQQAAVGLYCGGTFATPTSPIASCSSSTYGATRVVILPDGTEDDVTNPPRIAARNLFDLGFGVDNLFHNARRQVRLKFTVINLTNADVLYNFLSTFSGTHFVTPRAYQVQVGVTF